MTIEEFMTKAKKDQKRYHGGDKPRIKSSDPARHIRAKLSTKGYTQPNSVLPENQIPRLLANIERLKRQFSRATGERKTRLGLVLDRSYVQLQYLADRMAIRNERIDHETVTT